MPLELGETLGQRIEWAKENIKSRLLWDVGISEVEDAPEILAWLRKQPGVMSLEMGKLSQFQIPLPYNEKVFEKNFGKNPEIDSDNDIPYSLYAILLTAFEESQAQYSKTRDAGYILIYHIILR